LHAAGSQAMADDGPYTHTARERERERDMTVVAGHGAPLILRVTPRNADSPGPQQHCYIVPPSSSHRTLASARVSKSTAWVSGGTRLGAVWQENEAT